MTNISSLVIFGIGYTAAAFFYFASKLESRLRTIIFILLGIIVLGSPLMLSTDSAILRCLITLALIICFEHMWDLHLDPCRRTRLSFKTYMVFLLDFAWGVARVTDDYGANLSLKRRILDTVKNTVVFCLVSTIAIVAFRIDWKPYSFLLEHFVKSTCLIIWIIWAFNANTAIWRLAGAPAAPFIRKHIFLAHSPAEFWRRFDRPVHRWLYENVFLPIGGRRKPITATLTAFAVSACLHEYLLTVTLRYITGYVFVFFMLHGFVTVLTRRFKLTNFLVYPAIALTFVFNTLSTVLIFTPINERFPFYVNDLPSWVCF